ncbi:hypothetical protein IFR05_012607 [Cadophora sp. M221]|nr:hypothetical protein IFR05_012607 [Cadophora sp. M221]
MKCLGYNEDRLVDFCAASSSSTNGSAMETNQGYSTEEFEQGLVIVASKSSLDTVWRRFRDIAPQLLHSADKAAIGAFLGKFMSLPPFSGFFGGWLPALSKIYLSIESSSSLSLAMSTLIMTIQSRVIGRDYVSPEAASMYTLALQHTRNDLESIDTIKKPETLMAVMLLSLHEIINCPARALCAWTAHDHEVG